MKAAGSCMRMHSSALSSRISRARVRDEVGVEGPGMRASSWRRACLARERSLDMSLRVSSLTL